MSILKLLADSFMRILLPGLRVTIPLTLISFVLSLIIGTITALVQFANIRFLKTLARFYIWVIRGTPLLIQLFVVFYGLPNVGIRGALESIPKGQIEAGYCCGLNFLQVMWHIVLPQAFRVAFPSLANSLIAMVKNTSLAANITVMEMFMVTQQIVARTYQALALYLELAFIYLMISTILTKLQTYLEGRFNERGIQR